MPRPDTKNTFGVRLADDHVHVGQAPRVLTREQAFAFAAHLAFAASDGDRGGMQRFSEHVDAVGEDRAREEEEKREAEENAREQQSQASGGSPSDATLEQARRLLESSGYTVIK